MKRVNSFVKFMILSVIGSIGLSSHAGAVSFTPVGAAAYSGGTISSNNGYTYPYHSFAYGFGALFGFSMFPNVFAQFGVLYLPRGFDQSSTSLPAQQEVTFNTIHLPFTIHYYLMPVLAVGLGGYFSHGIGSISSYPLGAPASANLSAYGPNSYSADDFGLTVSLSFNLNLLPSVSLIVDGRYLYGLQNISQISSMSVYLRDFQVLAGVRLGR